MNRRTHGNSIPVQGGAMPYLQIQTNQSVNAEKSQQLMQNASKTVAEILGKSENYVMVALQQSVTMMFAGNNEPLAYLQLKSLGLPESSTADFSQALCDLVNKELGIAPERIYIEFTNPARHMWGWNNKTF